MSFQDGFRNFILRAFPLFVNNCSISHQTYPIYSPSVTFDCSILHKGSMDCWSVTGLKPVGRGISFRENPEPQDESRSPDSIAIAKIDKNRFIYSPPLLLPLMVMPIINLVLWFCKAPNSSRYLKKEASSVRYFFVSFSRAGSAKYHSTRPFHHSPSFFELVFHAMTFSFAQSTRATVAW